MLIMKKFLLKNIFQVKIFIQTDIILIIEMMKN